MEDQAGRYSAWGRGRSDMAEGRDPNWRSEFSSSNCPCSYRLWYSWQMHRCRASCSTTWRKSSSDKADVELVRCQRSHVKAVVRPTMKIRTLWRRPEEPFAEATSRTSRTIATRLRENVYSYALYTQLLAAMSLCSRAVSILRADVPRQPASSPAAPATTAKRTERFIMVPTEL